MTGNGDDTGMSRIELYHSYVVATLSAVAVQSRDDGQLAQTMRLSMTPTL
jgi:hypothetical protein